VVDADSEGVGAVLRLVHAEAVLGVTASLNLSRKDRVRTTRALEVGGVLAGELERNGLDSAVVLAEGVVGEVDVLVSVWVWWATTAVSWVGALGGLRSGCCHGGGTEEGGESEELHDVGFGVCWCFWLE